MITITKRFEFEAAHRLYGYDGPCSSIHGHTYVVEVTVGSETLDKLGMVIDFGVLKDGIGMWINHNWDHAFIYHREDGGALEAVKGCYSRGYAMVGNPTAENMATLLMDRAEEFLSELPVYVKRVRIWETPDSYAEVNREV